MIRHKLVIVLLFIIQNIHCNESMLSVLPIPPVRVETFIPVAIASHPFSLSKDANQPGPILTSAKPKYGFQYGVDSGAAIQQSENIVQNGAQITLIQEAGITTNYNNVANLQQNLDVIQAEVKPNIIGVARGGNADWADRRTVKNVQINFKV